MSNQGRRLERDRLSRAFVSVSVALAVLTAPLLALSVGFGPEGLGGDSNASSGHVAAYHRGELAGVVVMLFPAVSLAVRSLIRPAPRRRVALAGALLVQLIAFALFWVLAAD